MQDRIRPIRMLIAAGGTGGHVLPAVAVIEALRERDVPAELLWVGSSRGVERSIAERHGIPFRSVQTGKIRRYLSFETVTDLLRIPVGTIQAWNIVRRFKPDVIFSTGGADSVPTIVAGARSTPSITHEQTAQVGLANRTASRFVDRFAVSWEETARIARKMHDDVVVTGNPVRASIAQGHRDAGLRRFGFSPDLPVIYVTGGARGASPLNERIKALLPGLLDRAQIVHQAGPASANDDARTLRELRDTFPATVQGRYVVREFIDEELAGVYAMADLVISRSGAGTIAELAYIGKPAIVLPLPGTWGDEQRKNAAVLGNAGAAVVLEQRDATPERLATEIDALLSEPARRAKMADRARSLARPNAANDLLDEILELAHRS